MEMDLPIIHFKNAEDKGKSNNRPSKIDLAIKHPKNSNNSTAFSCSSFENNLK